MSTGIRHVREYREEAGHVSATGRLTEHWLAVCMSKMQTSLLLLSGVVWSRPVLTSSTMCLTASSVTGWASFLSLLVRDRQVI